MPITICPRCSHDNPDAPLYCARCGTDLEAASQQKVNTQMICPNCTSTVQADAFCSRCGASLSAPPQMRQPTPQAQKQISGIWQRLTSNQKIGVGCVGF